MILANILRECSCEFELVPHPGCAVDRNSTCSQAEVMNVGSEKLRHTLHCYWSPVGSRTLTRRKVTRLPHIGQYVPKCSMVSIARLPPLDLSPHMVYLQQQWWVTGQALTFKDNEEDSNVLRSGDVTIPPKDGRTKKVFSISATIRDFGNIQPMN